VYSTKKTYLRNKLDLSYLCIFGSKVFVHIIKEDRNKLEPKSHEAVQVIGYDEVTRDIVILYLRNTRY
jgi:hypothetical protein